MKELTHNRDLGFFQLNLPGVFPQRSNRRLSFLLRLKFLDNQQLGDDITEVVSYEGIYDSLAENGETVQVKGKLEKVIEMGTNRQYYRVLVGSVEGKGREYMKLGE